jgi:hypothetical protein
MWMANDSIIQLFTVGPRIKQGMYLITGLFCVLKVIFKNFIFILN